MELRRALQENSTVREPLLNARYEKQEVSGSTDPGCRMQPRVSSGMSIDANPAVAGV